MAALLGSEAGAIFFDALVLGAVAGGTGVWVHASTHLDELVAAPAQICETLSSLMIVAIGASAVTWITTPTIEKAFAVCL